MKKMLCIAILLLSTGSLFSAAGPDQGRVKVFNNTNDQIGVSWETTAGVLRGHSLNPNSTVILEQPRSDIKQITYRAVYASVTNPNPATHKVNFQGVLPNNSILITIDSGWTKYYDTITLDVAQSLAEKVGGFLNIFTKPGEAHRRLKEMEQQRRPQSQGNANKESLEDDWEVVIQ